MIFYDIRMLTTLPCEEKVAMRLSSSASLFPSGALLDTFKDSRDGRQYHDDFDFGFRYIRKVNLFDR